MPQNIFDDPKANAKSINIVNKQYNLRKKNLKLNN